jgi:hypothetical protein
MKSGSFEAFQVLVACQVIPPARRICRIDSRLIKATTPLATRCSAKFAQAPRTERQAQVTGAAPGDQADLATDRLTDRLWSAPAPFWVQRIEPHVVEVVDHPADVLG